MVTATRLAGTSNKGVKKVFATALTDKTSYDAEGIGCLRWEGNKCYKWVLYDTGAGSVAAVASQVAYYYTLDGYKNNTVTSDVTDASGLGAGILQAAPADGEYCWVQIKGAATLALALTTATDNVPLTQNASTTDGTLSLHATDTESVIGWSGDASDKEIICDFPF